MFTKQKKCSPSPLCGVLIGMLAAAGLGTALFLVRRRLPMMARTVEKAMKTCAEGTADVCHREEDS